MALLDIFRRKAPLPPPIPPSQLLRIGGRLIDTKDWAPETIAALKQEYFLPSFKDAFLMRINLTAGCPEQHNTTETIGVIGKKPDFVRTMVDEFHRLRIKIQCTTCGKRAVITGRTVLWQGDVGKWDGAT